MHTNGQITPLQSEFAGDPDMDELVELFVTELPARIEALDTAWNSRDLEITTRIAHQLKGASGGYGFPTIGDAAATLEDHLRGLEGDVPEDLVQSIQREVDQVIHLCKRAAASA
ncbi:MAG: Hpt domain-containing protein [Phycisphaerales bacterium]|nr:Hpt domain-containing protein [Phycisphaerales bacterium]